MGPLISNNIITENTNLFLAFLIGIAFGFVLEASGFSSSRKLAGVFYGYDTVVLKVFFTAAITGMVGLLLMSLFGWVDLSLVYVNPNYWPSALAGGVVMGAGFIMGGFCPGTSFCGAAIGKIDALVFIGGLFLGVFLFAEGYPMVETFFKDGYMGNTKLNQVFDISQGVMVLLIVLMAFGMFWAGEWAEKKFPREDY